MKKWTLVIAIASIVNVFACDIDGLTGFAPENNLKISAHTKSMNGIDESVFNQVIDEVVKVYEPVIIANGDRFTVNRKWDDGTVNASAQRSGKNVIVNMYGGLARHNLITKDGFAIVMCHELGHHLGGAPKVGGWFNKWASNEGQSDYFATLKCFRKVYGNDDNVEFISNIEVSPLVKEKCDELWANEADSALCKRSAMAAKSTASLLASLRSSKAPMFKTPDTTTVSSTNHKHPAAQCRLDTYFAGSLCDVGMDVNVSSKDPNIGTCNRKNGDEEGLRSLCWYKPE